MKATGRPPWFKTADTATSEASHSTTNGEQRSVDCVVCAGEQRSVEGTPFDLRTATEIGEALGRLDCDGYDHCFVLGNTERGLLRIAARFTHPASGRVLEVWTTEPGVQFYTGNFLPPAAQALGGRGGAAYTKQGAFCCEPQNLPDAVNQFDGNAALKLHLECYHHSYCGTTSTTVGVVPPAPQLLWYHHTNYKLF
ncbi:galactose mutarotase-like [Hyalella azteca]|uniref:Galactose mutarotase n=1 Tax=Hyalella azteca TaxID=294128 RepID=A0A979FSV0_HYAAZ|nr:galactose mutarotase-like [Hyalella azteca]